MDRKSLHLRLLDLVMRCKFLPRSRMLITAGFNYYDEYVKTGALADLEMAIQFLQSAIESTSKDDPDRLGMLHRVTGGACHDKHRMTGALPDLEVAIYHFQEAIKSTPDAHPERAARLYDLGIGYRNKYRKTGALTDLEAAIQQYQKAVEANSTQTNQIDQTIRTWIPVRRRNIKYRKLTLEDMDPTIQRSQETIDFVLDDHPDRGGRLYNLGAPWHSRYKKVRAPTDLPASVMQSQEIIEVSFDDHLDQAGRLDELGVRYYQRFREKGVLADLETAIQKFEEALDITPCDHLNRAGRLHSTGTGYRAKYQRNGNLTDLETAIQRSREALQITPDDHADRADRLVNLGASYHARYERFGALTDLETAIQQYQDALEASPDDHPDRADHLYSLGASYRAKYQRIGSLMDLETAIRHSRAALDITLDNHPDRPDRLCNLGAGFRERYRKTGALADLERAIQYYHKALKLTPDDHPDRANRLYNLGIQYQDRHRRTRWAEDLNTALRRYHDALRIISDDHAGRADLCRSLGAGYYKLYEILGSQMELDKATQWFEEAMESLSSGPINRLRPTIVLMRLLAAAGKWSQAYRVASTGMSLIPLIVPRFLETADKQHLLSEIAGFASDGAAIALTAGKLAYEAVRFLELGRGIILGTSSDLRTDMSVLKHDHPRLAEQYAELRNQLDTPAGYTHQVHETNVLTPSTLRSDQRYFVGRKFEELIQDIRELPGFEGFLLGLSEDEIKASAAQGPIIVINVSNYRCDAILVKKDKIRTLRLPRLHANDVRQRVHGLDSGAVDTQMLEWLWETISKPILDALDFPQTSRDVWPRIWWVPSGPLARLPLHAAGYYYHGRDTVLDRAISSYSSSISSLVRSRQNSAESEGLTKQGDIVLVGMPELLYAPKEIDVLKALYNGKQLQVNEPQRLQEDVLAALDSCEIFHCAGHGTTHPLDPSKSALILSDGELTVSRLFEANLNDRKPFLAYLSACGTGRVKFDILVDESLHLIAACQLAGFQHVVGTLWEVNDRSCVDVAKSVYGWMQDKDMSHKSVSEGLHHACRILRDQWVQENALRAAIKRGTALKVDERLDEAAQSNPSNLRDERDIEACDETPLHWVPYVHFGI